MARPKGTKYIETPEKMWELPYKKDKNESYIIIPPKRGYSGINSVNKLKNPNGYIYFIKAENQDLYKLGVSNNAQRRIKDIDSYLPFDLVILSIHYLTNVYDVEEMISKKLNKYNIRREWYMMSVDVASDIMVELYNINIEQDASN